MSALAECRGLPISHANPTGCLAGRQESQVTQKYVLAGLIVPIGGRGRKSSSWDDQCRLCGEEGPINLET
jgi:hypothetical protein